MCVRTGPAALVFACALWGAAAANAADILVNGTFDDMPLGTGWTQISDPAYPPIVTDSPVTPHSAPAIAWMGGITDYADAIYQDVQVPVGNTRLTLGGYVWIATQESSATPFDHLYAEILSPEGALLEVLRHWSNVDATSNWVPISIDAAGHYAGSLIRFRIRSTNDGSFSTNFFVDTCVLEATTTVAVESSIPTVSRLHAAAPNPTRAVSRWRLDLAGATRVHAGIYDAGGRLVYRLADRSFAAGSHELAWEGTNAQGGRAAAGIYFCVARVGNQAFEQKLALVH